MTVASNHLCSNSALCSFFVENAFPVMETTHVSVGAVYDASGCTTYASRALSAKQVCSNSSFKTFSPDSPLEFPGNLHVDNWLSLGGEV